jgi:Putative Zn-dependent protease, contains TPR repeats
MKRSVLFLIGLLLASSLFAQREEYNRAIINDDNESIIKYGEILLYSGKSSKELYRKLAQAYKEKSSYSKCIDYLTRAYQLDSNDVKTSFALGEAYLVKGDEELAMQSLLKVMDRDSKNTQALSLILKMNLGSGRKDLAEINGLELCLIDSTNSAYFLNLGRIYESSHKDRPSLKAYQKAWELNQNNLTINLLLCNAQIQTNQLDSAIRTAYHGLSITGNYKSRTAILLRRDIAKAFYRSGQYDSCLAHCAKLKADGDTIEDDTYKQAGYAYLSTKDHIGASEELQKVWDKNINNVQLTYEIPYYLGKSYLEINDTQKAIKYMSKALESLQPNNEKLYKTYLTYAECYLRMGKYDNAIEQINYAKWYKPDNTEPYLKIANIYEHSLKDFAKRNEELKSYLAYVDNIRKKRGAIPQRLEESYNNITDVLERNITTFSLEKVSDGKMRAIYTKRDANGKILEQKETTR